MRKIVNEVEIERIIVTAIWAILIGAAVAYVLTKMGEQPFDLNQSIAFSAIVFVFLLIVDFALNRNKVQN